MGSRVEFDFYSKIIKMGECLLSSVPKSVVNSSHYNAFNNGNPDGALIVEKKGRGSIIRVNPNKHQILQDFLKNQYPNYIKDIKNRVDSVAMFRDSKVGRKESEPIFFLRGYSNIEINNETLDLEKYTKNYGLFATKSLILKVDRLCFVENKDVFLDAEKILGSTYTFIHKYGRIGVNDLKNIVAKEVVCFSDYDFTGLNEYLNIKTTLNHCVFFIPDNYEYLFKTYSKELPKNKNLSDKINNSNDIVVKQIMNQIQKTNRFLEQESLFIEIK